MHGKPATLHLERLWIKDITITTGLVDTQSTPRLMELIAAGKLDPSVFATHRFSLDEAMVAYDAFAAAQDSGAFQDVLEGKSTVSCSPSSWCRVQGWSARVTRALTESAGAPAATIFDRILVGVDGHAESIAAVHEMRDARSRRRASCWPPTTSPRTSGRPGWRPSRAT